MRLKKDQQNLNVSVPYCFYAPLHARRSLEAILATKNREMYLVTGPKHKRILNVITEHIACDYCPLQIVEDEGLRWVMRFVNPKVSQDTRLSSTSKSSSMTLRLESNHLFRKYLLRLWRPNSGRTNSHVRTLHLLSISFPMSRTHSPKFSCAHSFQAVIQQIISLIS